MERKAGASCEGHRPVTRVLTEDRYHHKYINSEYAIYVPYKEFDPHDKVRKMVH